MINYNTQTVPIIKLVNDINQGTLNLAPHFQRKLVWREKHQIDFIETIMCGFPVPEIFLCKGEMNVELRLDKQYVVDGQQRLNAIVKYLEDKFKVKKKYFSNLEKEEQEQILNYRICLIELDLKIENKKVIEEIFERLNRTFYALNTIEKLSTVYASSDLMMLAKLVTGELGATSEDEDRLRDSKNIDTELYKKDPNITERFYRWGQKKDITYTRRYFINNNVFTPYEISRKQQLYFCLSIISAVIRGHTNRTQVKDCLEQYKDLFSTNVDLDKDVLVDTFEKVGQAFCELKFPKNDYWNRKSNTYTLFLLFYEYYKNSAEINLKNLKKLLINFGNNVPEKYELSARIGINEKKSRVIREQSLRPLIEKCLR